MRLNKVSYLCIVNLNILIMVKGKKQLSSKPKFAEVVIGDNKALDKRERVVFSKEERETIFDKLTNYIDIPDMPLDNNDTERLIRDMVMGKKAYLFCRDLDACKRAAMMYSLFGACKVLDKNPERWLCYVLKHIDSTPEDKYYTLLPEFWEDEEQ